MTTIALTPTWRARDRLTAAPWPADDDTLAWAGLGASHAFEPTYPRLLPTDQRPHALAYTAAYAAVFEAYMSEPDNVSTTLHIPDGGIAPALAAAWVQAAKNAPLLLRDAKNERTGHYTTADGVASQARTTLANEGLLWTTVGDRLSPPSLATCTIGNNQNYVGDVSVDWMLVHESGAVLRATSTAAVIAMPATPHDKAVQAAKTFLSGNVLRGLLCFVREDKHSTDARLDREAQAEKEFVFCKPETANAVATMCHELASLRNTTHAAVFQAAWKGVGFPYNADVTAPQQMAPEEAVKVHGWLDAMKSKLDTADAGDGGAP